MQGESSLHRGTMQKERKVGDGLKTHEDQAGRPGFTSSDLFKKATLLSETIFDIYTAKFLRFISVPRQAVDFF